MIVDCAVYRDGRREEPGPDWSDDLDALRKEGDGGFLWLGVHEPTAEEFAHVAEEFSLHPLAVEDALTAHQRPKLELYDDTLFLVLKTAAYDESSRTLRFGDVLVFVGADFVVSVRHGPTSVLAGVRHRLEGQPDILRCGPMAVVHAIADKVVDDYGDVTDDLEADIGELEEMVFSDSRTNDAEQIYRLKREVLAMRRAVLPLLVPLDRLTAGAVPLSHPAIQPFFRDVADHLTRVAEQVELFDDLLASALSANLAQVGLRQNADMRRISAWIAVVAVPTMLAGVWGMNFEHMPELTWRAGYPLALVLMATVSSYLYVRFRRAGWL